MQDRNIAAFVRPLHRHTRRNCGQLIRHLLRRRLRDRGGVESCEDWIKDAALKELGADGDETPPLVRAQFGGTAHLVSKSSGNAAEFFNRHDPVPSSAIVRDAMDLVILVGLPASGKTTYYRDHFADSYVHVSKDLMPNARRRDDLQERAIGQALQSGRSVVVDNTNPSPAVRAPLIALGRRHGARIIAYYFETAGKECLVRNRQREGKARVPDVAIFVTSKKLVPPSESEGFDEVHVVKCE